MKTLVTGGAGYIGSHVCRQLLKAGHDVCVLDDLSTGDREAVPKNARFVLGDVRDYELLKTTLADGIEAVIHCAAKLIIAESFLLCGEYYDVNVGGLLSLLRACRESGVDKVVFSSSSSVYGNAGGRGLIKEDSALAPLSPYAASKSMGERMLMDFERAYGLRSISLRYFNAAGAAEDGLNGQRGPVATHIVKVAAQAACGKRTEVPIYGNDYATPDGTCIRDYIHVEDLADVHCLALEKLINGASGEIYNVGYGRGYSVKQIIQVMRKVSGKHISVSFRERRAGDADSLIGDPAKVRQAFGWIPKRDDVEAICRSAYLWEAKLS